MATGCWRRMTKTAGRLQLLRVLMREKEGRLRAGGREGGMEGGEEKTYRGNDSGFYTRTW